MKNKLLRFGAVALSVILSVGTLNGLNIPSLAAKAQADGKTQNYTVKSDYDEYLANAKYPSAKESIEIAGGAYSSEENSGAVAEDRDGLSNVLVWEKEEGKVSYTFQIPQAATYNVKVKYNILTDNELNAAFTVLVDGKMPFEALEEIELIRKWTNDGKVKTDAQGNQYAPSQTPVKGYSETILYDPNGVIVEDLKFPFTAGEHTVTFQKIAQPVVIASVALVPAEETVSYKELKAEYEKKGYREFSGEAFQIEGEDAVLKTTRSLVPKSDTMSAHISPTSTTKSVINYIGSSNWKTPREELTWELFAPEDGLYQIGMCFKQSEVINGVSYRWLKIDGVTPFEEAKSIRFDYSSNWQSKALGENEPYLFYLTKGEHTLSLSVTMAETSAYYKVLEEMVEKIGDLYLDIVTITSASPDSNRDYDLFRQIPNFNESLALYRDTLNNLADEMQSLSGKRGSQYVAAIHNMTRVLQSMIDNKYTAQNYLNDYYTNYTTLGSWLYDMKGMPLSVDRIMFVNPKDELPDNGKTSLEKMWYSIGRFLTTFSSDYGKISEDKAEGETLKIWVNWGRDQAMVLNSLIREKFTPSTGINVNLELTNASLIKGMLSNIQPDLSLHLARTEPVNLAMRGALYDLTSFKDYEQVLDRFGESSSIPYEYNGGVYALPDTQSFYIMFYRTDIFEDLGLSVPTTWEEFIQATAVIQRNNLQVYLPYTQITAATTVNTGVGGLNLFGSILQQYGGSFYNEERNLCDLESATAFKAFTFWTDLYTKYRVPTTVSFYNRFRSGTVPLGIESYTTYTTLAEAAPEIQGRWGVSLVPGLPKEDGTVDHTVSGSGTGCSIISKSKHKDAAWEFLKWWTSADTQLQYNNDVESILGAVSRTTTATLNAFERMSWNRKDLKVLLEQRSYIKEVPEVPGSYYLVRSVDQAFWDVYNNGTNPKDVLLEWSEITNSEITRKIKEYS